MLSIIIVNWNTKAMLRACLASIERYPPSDEFEVIVVDNASVDGSLEGLVETAHLKLLPQPLNHGYAEGNNIAFRHARGEFILLLNPDTEFIDETLERACQRLQTMPRAGCIAARLTDAQPPHATQPSIRNFPTLFNLLGGYRAKDFDYDSPGPAPQPMGTFLLLRRQALDQVLSQTGGELFDRQFPIFFNEVDLLKRLHDQNWETFYDPSLTVRHHGGASTRQVRPQMIWESHRSLIRYFRKHITGPGRLLLPLASVIIYLGALVRAKGFNPGFRPDHHDL